MLFVPSPAPSLDHASRRPASLIRTPARSGKARPGPGGVSLARIPRRSSHSAALSPEPDGQGDGRAQGGESNDHAVGSKSPVDGPSLIVGLAFVGDRVDR